MKKVIVRLTSTSLDRGANIHFIGESLFFSPRLLSKSHHLPSPLLRTENLQPHSSLRHNKRVCLSIMDGTRTRDATFGDDYIPLTSLEQKWTPNRDIIANNKSRKSRRPTSLEHILSKPVRHRSNTLKDETCSSNGIIFSTFEADVKMYDVDSKEQSDVRSITRSISSQHVQTASHLGQAGIHGHRPNDFPLQMPLVPLISSTYSGDYKNSSSNTLVTSLSRMQTPAVREVFRLPSTQGSNESTMSSSIQVHEALQPHRSVASDLTNSQNIQNIQNIGNLQPPSSSDFAAKQSSNPL